MKKVAVIIPTINLWDRFTKPAIESLRSTNNKIAVVLVDNGSIDGTTEGFKQYGKDHINDGIEFGYIKNTDNVGCSIAWNEGIKFARDEFHPDYYLIINNDVLLNKDAIDNLVDFFEASDGSVVMATMCNLRDGLSVDMVNYPWQQRKDVAPEEHPDFSGFMISPKCLDEIGWFDEGYSFFGKAYYEDNDYHLRIMLSGLKAYNVPTAAFYHFGSQSLPHAHTQANINAKYFRAKWGCDSRYENPYKTPFNNQGNTLKWTWQDSNDHEKEVLKGEVMK